MPKRAAGVPVTVPLDERSRVPLHRQLYGGVRDLILSGRLAPGTRLPSFRSLASDLDVSRNTVIAALGQLHAEGYLESRVGSGTTVAHALPQDLPAVTGGAGVAGARATPRRALSRRGRLLAGLPLNTSAAATVPFRPSTPALDDFPIEIWGRLAARHRRHMPRALLGYGDALGHPELREAIAGYLRVARGVQCTGDQVAVVSGTQQALYLCAQLVLDPGDVAWCEDPGYPGARAALVAAGARIVPLPVDHEGLVVPADAARAGRPRLVYVSPSNQFPLGVTMSVSRRASLLKAVRGQGAWILEDDFDSEYRYSSRPIAALQGLDPDRRVIYIGTFSKTLFPSLRIGYVVLPPALVDAFRVARAAIDRHSPTLEQAVLADFITEGHLSRHIRRMRALYRERQEALVTAARAELGGLLDVAPGDAGIHLVGWLPAGASDRAAAAAAAARGVQVTPLSVYAVRRTSLARPGLLLSYGAFDAAQIRRGVERLAQALRGYAGESAPA